MATGDEDGQSLCSLIDGSTYRRLSGFRRTYTAKGLVGNPAGAILTTSTARRPSPLKDAGLTRLQQDQCEPRMCRCGEAELPGPPAPSNSFKMPYASMAFGALQRARRAFRSFSRARNSRMRWPTCSTCSSSKVLTSPQSCDGASRRPSSAARRLPRGLNSAARPSTGRSPQQGLARRAGGGLPGWPGPGALAPTAQRRRFRSSKALLGHPVPAVAHRPGWPALSLGLGRDHCSYWGDGCAAPMAPRRPCFTEAQDAWIQIARGDVGDHSTTRT